MMATQNRLRQTQNGHKNAEQQGLSFSSGKNEKWYSQFRRQLSFLQLGMFLNKASNATITLLYWKHWKIISTQKSAHVLMAALLIIDKNWRQPRCPLVSGYINKLLRQWTIIQQFFKKIEWWRHEMTGETLKCIWLSQRSQYGMILNIWHSGKGKTRESIQIRGCQGFFGAGRRTGRTRRTLRTVRLF